MSSFDAAFSGAAESHMQRALEGTAAGSEATEGGHSFLTPEGTTNGFGAGIAAATDLARWNHNSGENLAAEDDEAVIDSDDDIERDPAPAKIPLFQRPDFPVEVGQRFQTAFSGNVRLGETVSSTMKKIRPVVDRYWVPFCQEYEADPEACLYFHDCNKMIDLPKVRHFIQYCDWQKLSASQMKTIKLFVNTHYNAWCAAHGLPQQTGAVSRDPVVSLIFKRLNRSKATLGKRKGVDLQALLPKRIKRAEMLHLVGEAFQPSSHETSNLDLLTRTQTVAQIRQTHSTGQRGDDLRSELLHFNMVEESDFLSATMNQVISNDGKTNPSGNLTVTGMIPHINPLLDTLALRGTAFLIRFSVLGERFPDFLDWRWLSSVPIYRAHNSLQPQSKSTMEDNWRRFYRAADIVVNKLVHAGRGQSQQEMDDAGVAQAQISRLCGYSDSDRTMNVAQKQSYLTNVPLAAAAQRAGGDPRHPRHHSPAWSQVHVSDELLDLFAPFLRPEQARVVEEYNRVISEAKRAKKSISKALKDKRLVQAKGSVEFVRQCIEQALRLAATLPVDANNVLQVQSQPIFRLYAATFAFYRNLHFGSDQFAAFVSAMKTAQIDEYEHRIAINPAVGNTVEQLFTMYVVPALGSVATELRGVHRSQADQTRAFQAHTQQIRSELNQIWQLIGQQPPQMAAAAPTVQLEYENDTVGQGEEQPAPMNVRGPANKDGPGVLADGVSPRQRMPAVRREEYIGTAANRILQSSDNSTLEDFWNEFAHGRNGNPPLRDLEIEGMDWRRDVPGKTTFKTFWNYRCPMYNLITYYTEQQGHSEAEALEMARPLFDQIEKSRTGRPNLKKISKRFTEKMKELGMYQYRRWKQN
jgi:hypothetical protein